VAAIESLESSTGYSAIATLAVILSLAAVVAQQPMFRSNVENVRIDAVVTDKNDRPVTSLTQADFEIVERGRPQTITSFHFISIPSVHRTVEHVKGAAPSIDVVSNVHSPAGRQWVLVIDDLHIIEQHLVQTKKLAQAFLESLPAEDQVAIVFVGRSDLSQDFTSDLGAQLRTVERIKSSLGFAYDAADKVMATEVPAAERASGAERHRYAVASTDVLKNISSALARSSYSRKAIVYVSEGMTYPLVPFPDDTLGYKSDFVNRWRESFEIARRVGVPIYAVDPRGPADCTFVRSDCGNGPPMVKINNQFDHLRELSDNTGGRAFVSRPDIMQAVRELVDDNNSFYLLGYYPEPLERDGKFHDVGLKIKGRPDLKVRARAGYTAPKPNATATEAKQALDDALGAALPLAGLQLRAAAAPVAIAQKGMTTAVTVEVTYPNLPFTNFDDSLQFGIVALDHDGRIKAQMRDTYEYSATSKPGQTMSYIINAPIDLPAQALTLRVAVASQALDRVASIQLPVEVINPSRDALQIGAVVLGFKGPPRQAAVPAGALKGLVPFQPTLVRAFTASDTLQIHAPLFWRGVEGTSAVVTIAVRDRGAVVRSSRVTVAGAPVNSRTISRAQQGAVTPAVGLQGLVPGDYTLDLEARLITGPIARRTVTFSIH
jgi:VWFA-related protein